MVELKAQAELKKEMALEDEDMTAYISAMAVLGVLEELNEVIKDSL